MSIHGKKRVKSTAGILFFGMTIWRRFSSPIVGVMEALTAQLWTKNIKCPPLMFRYIHVFLIRNHEFGPSTESFLKLSDFEYSEFLTMFMFTNCSLEKISKHCF